MKSHRGRVCAAASMTLVAVFAAFPSAPALAGAEGQGDNTAQAQSEGRGAGHARTKASPASTRVRQNLAKMPLRFEPNMGQAGAGIDFISRGPGYKLALKAGSATFSLAPVLSAGDRSSSHRSKLRPAAVSMRPAGGRISKGLGASRLESISNYLLGSDPAKWRTGVPNYRKVRYREVYPGIDLVFYGAGGGLEYDFVVSPKADPKVIGLLFEGQDKLRLNKDGDLLISTGAGVLRQKRPFIYQKSDDGEKRRIAGSFHIAGPGKVVFKIGRYDRSRPLIIDPLVDYSTYLGGTNADYARSVATDASGAAYVVGGTSSATFPPGVSKTNPSADAFISKVNPAGTALEFSTYLGGTGGDEVFDVALGPAGALYVTGETSSADFPLAVAPRPGGLDSFVSKLSSDGQQLFYSTYIGTDGQDSAKNIALGPDGSSYVSGTKQFLTSSPTRGATDAFVAKVDSTGALSQSADFGGDGSDDGADIAVDPQGNVYLTGSSTSLDFGGCPALSYKSVHGDAEFRGVPNRSANADAYLLKWNPSSSCLSYFSFLGGDFGETGTSLALGPSGTVFVGGSTASVDFPLKNAFQKVHGGGVNRTTTSPRTDGFVAKLDPNVMGERSLIYSSYLGGVDDDAVSGIVVDSEGGAYLTGQTQAPNFPVTPDAPRSRVGIDVDAFVAQVTGGTAGTPATTLLFSTLVGGGFSDFSGRLVLDCQGRVVVSGQTLSTDFPQASDGAFGMNPIQSGGNWTSNTNSTHARDGFVTRVDLGAPPPAAQSAVAIACPSRPANGLAVSEARVTEIDSAGKQMQFKVTLPESQPNPVSVSYGTVGSTATKVEDFSETAGTLVFAPGDTERTVAVDIAGDNAAESDETFSLNLANPVNATIFDRKGVGTIVDDDQVLSTPTSILSIDDVAGVEGSAGPGFRTNFVFRVSLASRSSEPVTVDYVALPASASPADFDKAGGPITFTPGETQKEIVVFVVADNEPERDEFFQVYLVNNENSVVAKNFGVGLVRDDDGGNAPPALSISDVVQSEGDSDSTEFTFRVRLTAPSGNMPVYVEYMTANGTAEHEGEKNDYEPITDGSLTFNPGETEKTITVQVNGDTNIENNEFFQVFLMNAQNAATIKSQAVGVILQDD